MGNRFPAFTIGAVAEHFKCSAWKIRRLFERNLLPPAPRMGTYRIVLVRDLPKVEKALRQAGYLPSAEEQRQ